MEKKTNYNFIGKTLFFPEKKILAVGDLHIGYEYMLQQSGILLPERQIEEVISEMKGIFKKIRKGKQIIKKIIFIGDIKHSFEYKWKEKNYFRKVLDFLKHKFKDENIILIKGNHDTIDYSFSKRLKDYYIEGDVAFSHGHKSFLEIFDKKIKTIVLGHVHPSVVLSDYQNIKREKYKCFLVGKFSGKETIILPSFLSTVEGQNVNEYKEEGYEDGFSIVPKKELLKFRVFVVGEKRVYEFGRVGEI